MNIFLTVSEEILATRTQSPCRSPRTELYPGLSAVLMSPSLWKKNLVLVSCVFWQRQSDLFVSHISTTMQSLLVFGD